MLDDSHTLLSNAFIQSFSGFSSIWSTGRAYSSLPSNYGYRPVTTTMNMVLWWMGGGSTLAFHLAKMLIFLLTCWMLAKMWRVFIPWAAPEVIGAAVILFVVNPVHTQVVSYISAIATQWAALFICASVLSYLQFRQNNLKRWHLVSLIFAFLAILSKEEGVVIVALIPLVELYLRKLESTPIFSTRRLGSLALYVLVGILGVGLIAIRFEPLQNLVRADMTTMDYFMTQWRAYLRYFVMYFYSYDLNGDNLAFGFSSEILNKDVLIALAINLGLLISVILSWRKRPVLAFALVWFYIGVSPASSVVILSEPVNDHRAFIGYFGFAIFGILLLNWLRTKNRIVFLMVVAIATCTYGTLTFKREDIWSTTEKFWSDTVYKNPTSARAHNNLALEMIHQNRYDRALSLLDRCTEIRAGYPVCYINRAVALSHLGRDAEADLEFSKATKFDPTITQSRFNWAKFLSARGQFSKAQILLDEADQVAQGKNLEIRLELISVIRQQGEKTRAKKLFEEMVSTFGHQPRFLAVAQGLGLDY